MSLSAEPNLPEEKIVTKRPGGHRLPNWMFFMTHCDDSFPKTDLLYIRSAQVNRVASAQLSVVLIQA